MLPSLRSLPLCALLLWCSLLLTQVAQASVVMVGTRVIYTGDLREKTLQFSNTDEQPDVVQIWIDDGSPNATPETAQSPFVATPQVFRLGPKAGQMVRLIFDGSSVPQDRESVYYLNFTQVPAIRSGDQTANKLMLLFNSRLKVFYRPVGLAGTVDNMADQLQIGWHDGALQVHNPTPYHAMVREAHTVTDRGAVPLRGVDMIAPFATVRWQPQTALPSAAGLQIRLIIVNDFGADVVSDRRL